MAPASVRAYVETFAPPAGPVRPVSVLFVHGGGHTGACYRATPDGREGWAPHFARAGFVARTIDWPGHGRSPAVDDLARMPMERVVDAVVAELDAAQQTVLVTHSMGGTIGWAVAERVPERIAAIVAIAPGPPANLQPPLTTDGAEDERIPVAFTAASAREFWANSERFPHAAFDAYLATLVPESARAVNQRNNVVGRGLALTDPDVLRRLPILIVTGDQDTRHPRAADERIAEFLGADFLWLPDRGFTGHGHMMMIEHGNLEIADLLIAWIGREHDVHPRVI